MNTGLRNTPIDRRRLNMQDRGDFNRGGGNNSRQRAISRVRSYRGNLGRQNNTPMRTQVHTPGTGGFTNREPGYRGPDYSGISRQQVRNKVTSNQINRAESLRPEKINVENIFQK